MKKSFAAALAMMVAATAGCGQPTSEGRLDTQGTRNVRSYASFQQGERQIVRIRFKDERQLETLSKLGLDLFENVDMQAGTVDGSVTARDEASLRQAGLTYQVLQRPAQVMEVAGSFMAGYHTVDSLYADYRKLVEAAPGIARIQTLGKSLQGNDIIVIRITSKPEADLPGILIDSGHHARELPPVEVSFRLVSHLLSNYGKDERITRLIDTRDIWVVPVVNPDGRKNVESGDAWWRKNMRRNADGSQGVDINRNYDDHWTQGNNRGSADDFHGTAPNSEPETQVMAKLFDMKKFNVSVDIHNYGGMVLWPFGFSKEKTRDEFTYQKLAAKMAKPIRYRAGSISRTIYNTYGDFSTWQYVKHGTIAFGVELNDSGFSAPFREVDRDWNEWRENLLYLIDISADPRAAAARL